MEKEYYIVSGDERKGPFSLYQLSQLGIEPSTLVWTAGMSDWTRADAVPELESLLSERLDNDQQSAFGGYAAPPRSGNSFQPENKSYGRTRMPQGGRSGGANASVNWKTLSIVATVVSFLFSCIGGIVGIFAILQANKAQKADYEGDEYTSMQSWSTCKTLTIISFVLAGIGLISNLVMQSKMTEILQQLNNLNGI